MNKIEMTAAADSNNPESHGAEDATATTATAPVTEVTYYSPIDEGRHPLSEKVSLIIETPPTGFKQELLEDELQRVAQVLGLDDASELKSGVALPPSASSKLRRTRLRYVKIVSTSQALEKLKKWKKPEVGQTGWFITLPSEIGEGGLVLKGGKRGRMTLRAAGARFCEVKSVAYSLEIAGLLAEILSGAWKQAPEGEVIASFSSHWLRMNVFLSERVLCDAFMGLELDQERFNRVIETDFWKFVSVANASQEVKEAIQDKYDELPTPDNTNSCKCCEADVGSVRIGKIHELEDGSSVCGGCAAEHDPDKNFMNLMGAQKARGKKSYVRMVLTGGIAVSRQSSTKDVVVEDSTVDEEATAKANQESSAR